MKYDIKITKAQQSRLAEVDFNNLPFGRTFSDHMFVADYRNGQWENARIVPFSNFTMHPASMVLHYGQAVFEGMKAFKDKEGNPVFFRPEMHAKRINASAERMCMPKLPEELFLEAVHSLIGLDQNWIPPQIGSALYIRPFMFATDEFIGVRPADNYTFMIFSGPVGPYYSRPVRLYAEQKYVRAVKGGVGEAKAAGNYAASLLPAKLAHEKGYDQIMWMDAHEFKYIQEVGTMNIFFVIDDVVVTPSTDGAILKGITRDSMLTLLKDNGYKVEERPVSIDELIEADAKGTLQEAFGTGTAAVVSHVSEIAYQDKVLKLPPVEQQNVSAWAKKTIEEMRAGKIEDKYDWIVPVQEPEAVEA